MRFLLTLFLLVILSFNVKSQAINDYGAIATGNWTTVSIWRQWDGIGWNTVPVSYPNSLTSNVWILTNSIVTVNGVGPYNVGNITVQNLGKLYANNTVTNIYLNVWGSNIICDGEIGNGILFDGIGFNIEGLNCTISGAGLFTASRIRKSNFINPTTNLFFSMDVALRWSNASATAIYNNVTGNNAIFNVTVNQGYTLNIAGSSSFPANLSIDGVNGLGTGYDVGGTFTVNGTVIVSGILYASTNNDSSTYNCNITVGVTGYLKVGQINSPASGFASPSITATMNFIVQNGGVLDLMGSGGFYFPTWNIQNNIYSFLPGSTVIYSSNSVQTVLQQTNFNITSPNFQYSNLIISGSGIKVINPGILTVRNNLTISGSAILDQEVNDPKILIGGNWTNYNQVGFTESTNTSSYVRFINNNPIQQIFCSGGEIFYNLWIAKPGTFTIVELLDNITVNNILTLGLASTNYNGILRLNQRTLTLTNPLPSAIKLEGTVGTFRYIISEFVTNASRVNWNIGTNNGNYIIPFGRNQLSDTIPLFFNKNNSANIGQLSIATYGTTTLNLPWPATPVPVTNLLSLYPINNVSNPANSNIPDNRYWTINRYWYIGTTNPVESEIIFTYDRNELTDSLINSQLDMRAQYWDIANSTWHLPQLGNTGNINYPTNSVKVDTVINYNTNWTLSSIRSPLSSSPLPVELVTFEGEYVDGESQITWVTASEDNNDHFTLLISVDGENYTEIVTLEGAGTTSNTSTYNYFYEQSCLTGILYYKLQQVDFDGVITEYGPIVFPCPKEFIREPIKTVNVLGQTVNDDYMGLKITFFNDGTFEKSLKIVDY